MAVLEEHEDRLRERIETGLLDLGLPSGRAPRPAPRRCSPTSADRPAADLMHALAAAGVNAPAGHFYALEASRWLGLGDEGGLRIGVAPYTDDEDVDRLLGALAAALG